MFLKRRSPIRPADIVAIEVIKRLCSPCSEFLRWAEHWYASTGLEDLLGIPDVLLSPRIVCIEPSIRLAQELKRRSPKPRSRETIGHVVSTRLQPGTLRPHEYLLRGLAAENELAHEDTLAITGVATRKQIVVALVVTKDGFLLVQYRTFAGNTQDLKTVQTIVWARSKTQFGTSCSCIWVMDHGMISDESLKFLGESNRRYLLATKRGERSRLPS